MLVSCDFHSDWNSWRKLDLKMARIYHPLTLEKNIGENTPVLRFHHLYSLILSYIAIFFIVTGEMTGYWDFKKT